MDGSVVSSLSSEDGKHRLEIQRLANGMFRFVEETEMPGDEYTGPYFSPTHWSGLYESADAAELDAKLTLPWLRNSDSTETLSRPSVT